MPNLKLIFPTLVSAILLTSCYRQEVTTDRLTKKAASCEQKLNFSAVPDLSLATVTLDSPSRYLVELPEAARFVHISWNSTMEAKGAVGQIEVAGKVVSELQPIDQHDEHHDHDHSKPSRQVYSVDLLDELSSFYIILQSESAVEDLQVQYESKLEELGLLQSSNYIPDGYQTQPTDFKIVSRNQWAAGQIQFPAKKRSFTTVERVVVHHTAGYYQSGASCEFIMRSIYKYHTEKKKWDDTGYQFLVCPDGTVYEGRGGGKGVVGAHTLGSNYGTVAISLIGNYDSSKSPINSLSTAAENSVTSLIAWLALEHELDLADPSPYSQSNRTGVAVPAITWHNFMSTNVSLSATSSNCAGDSIIQSYLKTDRFLNSSIAKLEKLSDQPVQTRPEPVVDNGSQEPVVDSGSQEPSAGSSDGSPAQCLAAN